MEWLCGQIIMLYPGMTNDIIWPTFVCTILFPHPVFLERIEILYHFVVVYNVVDIEKIRPPIIFAMNVNPILWPKWTIRKMLK